MKKILIFFSIFALCSCRNDQLKMQYESDISLYRQQIDSLTTELNLNKVERDSLKAELSIKDNTIGDYEHKIQQYKELVKEYKTVLYAIVGEDGMYHYTEIDK